MILALPAGYVLGFVGSMPIAGPISVLVLERSLRGAPSEARGVGVGASVAEASYATLAFVGVGELLLRHRLLDSIAQSVAALIMLGVATALLRGGAPSGVGSVALPGGKVERAPHETCDDEAARERARRRGFRRGFVVGFGIAILNPALLATWSTTVAALHGAGLVETSAPASIGFFVGTQLGIASWLVALVTLVDRYGASRGPELVGHTTRVAGVFVSVVALVLFGRVVW